MTNSFELWVGGEDALEDASEYTGQCIRCNYKKVYLSGNYEFSVILEDVNQSDSNIAHNANVFFIVNKSGSKYLLMKGYIEDITWSNRVRAEIKGKQSQRCVDGGSGMFSNARVPMGTQLPEITVSRLGTEAGQGGEGTWWSLSESKKDDGQNGYSERDLRKE